MDQTPPAGFQTAPGANFHKSFYAGKVENTGHIHVGDNVTYATPPLLQEVPLRIPGEGSHIVKPTNINRFVDLVNERRLIVLEAPPGWGAEYVAEALAKEIIDQSRSRAGISSSENYTVYRSIGAASGRALVAEIERIKEIKNCPVIIHDAMITEYAGAMNALWETAETRKLHFILLTSQGNWKAKLPNEPCVELNEKGESPYSDDDLAKWLFNVLKETDDISYLDPFWGNQERTLTRDMLLYPAEKSLYEIAHDLQSPGLIGMFPARLRALANPAELPALIKDMIDGRDTRWKDWFDALSEDNRHIVLALSLVYELPQEVFWAIYEQLSLDWRERIVNLHVIDYQSIRAQLDEYITIENAYEGDQPGTQIRFKTPDVRLKLIEHASQGYRRSLVQALPVLGNIITAENQSASGPSQLTMRRLRDLDILGSDLAHESELQSRHNNLRAYLISNIVYIRHLEPITSDHLLVSWAQGTHNDSWRSFQRQNAFADTLVRMYQSETPTNSLLWYQSRESFKLLYSWYARFRPEDNRLDLNDLFEVFTNRRDTPETNRTRVRSAMVLALYKLANIVDESEFGSTDQTDVLFKQVPAEQELPLSPTSPWHMLMALAWDRREDVRASVVSYSVLLYNRYPSRFESILLLLASDWSTTVRERAASVMAHLYDQDRLSIYLINDLLDREQSQIVRTVERRNLYLRVVNRLEPLLEFPYHLWTGVLTILRISLKDLTILTAYLHTRVATPVNIQFDAFQSVLIWILEDEERREVFKPVLKYILLDRTGDNRASQASLELERLYNNQRLTLPLSNDEIEEFKEARIEQKYAR